MRAWQMVAVGEPLVLVELPDPEPGPGQVIVDVAAAGLCHSDVGFLDGSMASMLKQIPIVLGHEVAGTVSALGPGVEGFAVGDRVGIAGDGLDAPGIVLDGGFGERCIGKVAQLVPVPDSVSFAQAAAGTDAGMTSYHAVKVAGGVTQGSRVGIIGLGGLGLTGAKIAVSLGAEVYAAEINTGVHDLAREAGVIDVVADATDLARYELDVIIDFAGAGVTTAAAVEAVSARGRIVQVGMARSEMTLPTQTFVSKQLTLIGSLGGKKEDTAAVYDLMAQGKLEILTTSIPFGELAEGIERLHRGEVRGRLVAAYE